MASVVSAAVAEEAAQTVGQADRQIRMHTASPGTTGLNEVTGLEPVLILAAAWAAFVDDTATLAQGGRVTDNTAEIALGTATVAETATWLTLWGDDTTPDTYDVFKMAIELTSPVSWEVDNPVVIQAGDLDIFGAGEA